jgi:hypothetical protein
MPSKPPSSVDATLAGDASAPTQPPAARAAAPAPALRGSLLVALCFLVGVAGMALAAWRLGSLGRAPEHAEAPRPAPVQELVAETLHDPVVPALVEGPVAPLPPLDVTPPRASAARASASASASASPPPSASTVAPVRVTIDASSTRPSVGQPVDFAGHVVGAASASGSPRRLDGARFRIVGPGIPQGTEMPAFDDGTGDFRTTFTFLQAGRFDVDFAAKADGTPVHSVRSIAVGDPTAAAPPAPAPSPTRAQPQSSAATKWL